MGRLGPALYVSWVVLAIGISLAATGLTPENVTRLLVVAFLLVQLALRRPLAGALPRVAPRIRFVVLGTLLAAVVEGFHMISKPVFASLRVDRATPPSRGLAFYGVDLLFTVPAYVVIFSVLFFFVARYRYGAWAYAVGLGFAQTIGDGGLFFFAKAPALLLFLPYPMTNYHAVNVIPFLAVRDGLPEGRRAGGRAWLAVPAVIATYLVCGAAIQAVGRACGLQPP